MTLRTIVNTPRSPGRAATQIRFTRLFGRRFVIDNLALLRRVAAACSALEGHATRVCGRGVNIFTQWIGDPDALGSAVLLQAILQQMGAAEVRILTGCLGHPQNRTLVERCGIRLGDPNADRIPQGLNCVVDAAPPLGSTNTLRVAPERDYLFVADHHAQGEMVRTRCHEAGVRSVQMAFLELDVGSTSSFLAAIAASLGLLPMLSVPERAASGLGIYTDTNALLHGATPLDIRMFEQLTGDPAVRGLLDELRSYRVPYEWHGYTAPAYLRAEQIGRVRFAPVGRIPVANRDVIAEIADELLRVDGTALAIAVCLSERGTEMSLRADSRLIDGDGERVARVVGRLLEEAFQGVSGYKHQRQPPHRVEGGAHLPRGDPREARFLVNVDPIASSDRAAVEHCRACARYLIELLREQQRRAPSELAGIL